MGAVVCCQPCRFDAYDDDDDDDPYGPPRSSRASGSRGNEYDALTREDQAKIRKWLQNRGSKSRQKAEISHIDLARKALFDEMINFETLYARALEDLHIHFVVPLCDPKSTIISHEQAMRIFSNIGALEAFHRRFLDQLKTSVNTVELFQQELCEFLDNYRFYITSFHLCLQTVDRVARNPKFQRLLDDVRQEYSIELMPLLFAPIEQLSIYTRFLNSLMDVTHPMHSEFSTLQEAATRVAELFVELSERKTAMLNMTTMLAVQNRLRGDFDSFVRPDRRFICDGELDQLSTSVSSVRETSLRVVFVFNDLLIWATDRYKFKGAVDLTRISIDLHYEEAVPITSAMASPSPPPSSVAADARGDASSQSSPPAVNGIQMYQPTGRPPLLVLLFRSTAQKKEWLEALKQIPSPRMRPPDTSPIGFSTVNSSNFGARSPQRRISHISAASGDSPTDARQISSPSPSLLSTGGGGVLARSSSLPGGSPPPPRPIDDIAITSLDAARYVTAAAQSNGQFAEVSGSGTSVRKPRPHNRALSASSLFAPPKNGNAAAAAQKNDTKRTSVATEPNGSPPPAPSASKPRSFLAERLRRHKYSHV